MWFNVNSAQQELFVYFMLFQFIDPLKRERPIQSNYHRQHNQLGEPTLVQGQSKNIFKTLWWYIRQCLPMIFLYLQLSFLYILYEVKDMNHLVNRSSLTLGFFLFIIKKINSCQRLGLSCGQFN